MFLGLDWCYDILASVAYVFPLVSKTHIFVCLFVVLLPSSHSTSGDH